jgi:cytochrome c-type biogenesis protein CcmE
MQQNVGWSPIENTSTASTGTKGDFRTTGLPLVVKVGVVVALLGCATAFLLFGSQSSNAFVYSKFVNEVLAQPKAFTGRELRVEGDLQAGSIAFRQDPCEWRFILSKSGHSLPVRFPQCVVPDSFRDGRGIAVTVQGQLQNEGWFLANQVIPRCPSKYEMDEKKQTGEAKPHR